MSHSLIYEYKKTELLYVLTHVHEVVAGFFVQHLRIFSLFASLLNLLFLNFAYNKFLYSFLILLKFTDVFSRLRDIQSFYTLSGVGVSTF